MVWASERREVGVFTRVLERQIVTHPELQRRLRANTGVPMYSREREGSVKYTLGFDYIVLKTGCVTRVFWADG